VDADSVRRATLDLADDELDELLASAARLAAREIRATRDGPVFSAPPALHAVAATVGANELPQEGEPLEDVLAACATLLDAGRRTAPGFFGYVLSPPAPVGVAADLLASAADQNVTAWRSAPAATEVEHQVVRWLGQFVGFASDATGLLVGGGSAANLAALLVAVGNRAPTAHRAELVVYASSEAHFSVAKAAGVLGVQFRSVPATDEYQLDVHELAASIRADRAAGHTPLCVVGTAGSTATGAVDALEAIATLADIEGLWFHVDGAYGAPAASHPAHRSLFAGLDRAASLSIDAHKWLYAPVDCGALLFADPDASARAFATAAGDYVRVLGHDAGETFAFWDHGLELSRRFRALKVWMSFRHYGARRISEAIADDIDIARYMAALVDEDDAFELLAPPGLSVCCFRHVPAGVGADMLDAHNQRLLGAIQRDGRVYFSNATVGADFGLRACITNFRTTRSDARQALDVVRELASWDET
jgi:aromatic-L-amino-acid/L-tryptophan decarboxylase